MNAACHYTSDHSNCFPHGSTKEWPGASKEHAKEVLELFLSKTLIILQKVRNNITTQLIESFHTIKAKFAGKDYLWLGTWKGRVAAQVLQFNSPNVWKFEFYQKLGFETLSNEAKEDLEKKFKLAEQKSKKRSDKEYQISEVRRRNIKHQKIC